MFKDIEGVPDFECISYQKKKNKYCVCIPIINEGERIKLELERAKKASISNLVDIIICDGDSKDGSIDKILMKDLGVNTILIKKGPGRQGAQLKMGFWWALNQGYDGIITIDGNNKDSIEDIPKFIRKLNEGYDFVQGSRFIKGGFEKNTPFIRLISIRLIHAPIISLTAKKWYTDTTNNYRAYSKRYLTHKEVNPFRDVFYGYELLAFLSVKADQLKLKTCEIPVSRSYSKDWKKQTKINSFRGNGNLLKILFKNLFGKYNVKEK